MNARLSIVTKPLGVLVVLLLTVLLGCGQSHDSTAHAPGPGSMSSQGEPHTHLLSTEEAQAPATLWTCSMHPQIQLPEPGKCPICGMDLIPLSTGPTTGPEPLRPVLELSRAAAELADIRTTPVVRRNVEADIRLSGTLEPDERRMREISAYIPGRLEELYVDFTGVEVRAGEPLLEIYSPELISAQEELLQALRTEEATRESPLESLRDSGTALRDAAREKLRLLGLSSSQIRELERTRRPQDQVTILSPLDGIVMHKAGVEGMYVETGTHIYSVADLTQLWATLDAYESDLAWLRLGQEVRFTTQAFPGEVFEGSIGFIDPVVAPETRTARIRVDVPNSDRRLKPGMYVQATVQAGVPGGGERLVIPATAPLITGRRAVVYVRDPEREVPTFEGREILLGPRAGDWYVVADGLRAGEEIVSQGAFKIDSALQIQAKPSMMQPETALRSGAESGAPSLPGSLPREDRP